MAVIVFSFFSNSVTILIINKTITIMSIFKKVFNWISGLFAKGSDELETVIIPAAITITKALKLITDFDGTDIVGHLAGSAGAALEEKLKSLLPTIIEKLQLAQMFKGQAPNQTLANILRLIGTADPITKTAFWIEFSGMVASALQDGKLDLGESAAIVKYWYDNHPAELAAAA